MRKNILGAMRIAEAISLGISAFLSLVLGCILFLYPSDLDVPWGNVLLPVVFLVFAIIGGVSSFRALKDSP